MKATKTASSTSFFYSKQELCVKSRDIKSLTTSCSEGTLKNSTKVLSGWSPSSLLYFNQMSVKAFFFTPKVSKTLLLNTNATKSLSVKVKKLLLKSRREKFKQG